MTRLNRSPISKGLHGFISYQNRDAVLKELSIASLSPTNRYACGLFSVHHALVFLGHGDSIQNMKGHHSRAWDLFWNGLYLDQLSAIVRKAGAKSDYIESTRLRPIRPWLDRHLVAGHPVIIGSEPYCHWCCLGGRTSDGGYVWADSAEHPSLGISAWDELAEWMGDEEVLGDPYQALAVIPGRGMPASRSIVPWIAGVWETWAGEPRYAREWSNLLADMLQVFWDAAYVTRGIPAGDFLDEHAAAIVEAVSSLNGWNDAVVRGHSYAYRDAAHFHNLVVDPGQEPVTIARFTLMLQARAGQTARARHELKP